MSYPDVIFGRGVEARRVAAYGSASVKPMDGKIVTGKPLVATRRARLLAG